MSVPRPARLLAGLAIPAGMLASILALPTGCMTLHVADALGRRAHAVEEEFRELAPGEFIRQAEGVCTAETTCEGTRSARFVFPGLLAGPGERAVEVTVSGATSGGTRTARVREVPWTGEPGAPASLFVGLSISWPGDPEPADLRGVTDGRADVRPLAGHILFVKIRSQAGGAAVLGLLSPPVPAPPEDSGWEARAWERFTGDVELDRVERSRSGHVLAHALFAPAVLFDLLTLPLQFIYCSIQGAY